MQRRDKRVLGLSLAVTLMGGWVTMGEAKAVGPEQGECLADRYEICVSEDQQPIDTYCAPKVALCGEALGVGSYSATGGTGCPVRIKCYFAAD